MRQLMAGYVVTLALLLIGTFIIGRSSLRLRGVRPLCTGFTAALLAVALSALRDSVPLILSVVVGNILLLVSYSYIHRTTEDVLGLAPALKGFWLVLYPLYTAGFCYYALVDDQITVRILILSAAIGCQTALTAVVLYRHKDPELHLPTRSLACLLLMISALAVGRFVLTALHPPPRDFFKPDLIQAGYIYLNLILSLGLSGGILWLSLCAQRNEWKRIANTDGLTGLLNRRVFEDLVQTELLRIQAGSGQFSILLLDIDHFKEVNDRYGHLAGDEVIRRVGAALRDAVRPTDPLARFGGEEFVLMLRSTDAEQAMAAAERMRQEIEMLQGLPGPQHITASIGVAASRREGTVEEVINRADDALYRSKRAGRNRVTGESDRITGSRLHV
jgi:diguanylate cyclase (GGDEF)-like protein